MTFLYPQFLILFLVLFWIGRKKSKYWILYLSFSLMIVALMRPVISGQKVDETLNAKEIIIALDVSYSMRADDIKPSRLDKAKVLIEQILVHNKNNKYSLFAFTTNPLILSPSTTDHKLLLSALHSLKIDNILTHGTNFKTLFSRISKMQIPLKNLLLFTDGGDFLIQDVPKDLRIFAVGLASSKGSTLMDSYGKKIKDSNGNLVISRLNPNLKTLAEKSGGSFMRYDEVDVSLDFVDQSLKTQRTKVGYLELFWIPLILALVLFLFSFISIPKKFLALIPFLTLHADAGLLDWYHISQAQKSYHKGFYKKAIKNFEKIEYITMQSQMNLANSYYQVGNFKKAKSLYALLSSSNVKLKKVILYKLGNCNTKLKKYDQARSYYQKALVFGNDKDIVYNLKLIATKKQKQRRDFPAFKCEDKAKEDTPQGSKKQKSVSKGGKKSTKTGMGTKSSGQSSKTKSSSKKIQNSKLTRPMGFKAYELINKGYISEKNPW